MFLISDAYAQTAAPAAAAGDNGMFMMLLFGGLAVVMLFTTSRKQMKAAKETKAMLEALAKGDEVVTAGGVLGRVAKLGDTYVHLDTGGAGELQVQRSAIVQVLPKGTMK